MHYQESEVEFNEEDEIRIAPKESLANESEYTYESLDTEDFNAIFSGKTKRAKKIMTIGITFNFLLNLALLYICLTLSGDECDDIGNFTIGVKTKEGLYVCLTYTLILIYTIPFLIMIPLTFA